MKNTDENIRKKINEISDEDLPFDEANLWNRLEEKLDKKSPKIVFVNWQRWAAAASILLFFGIGFVVFNMKNNENFVENKVKNTLQKRTQVVDNQIVMKEKVFNKPNILKQDIFQIKPKKEAKKNEDLAKNENIKNEVLVTENEEKIEVSPKIESIKINEIQSKNIAINTKNIDIKTPILAPKNEVETTEKPHRRFAFSIKIFPSLTTPDTTPTPLYASGESPNQIKIKF